MLEIADVPHSTVPANLDADPDAGSEEKQEDNPHVIKRYPFLDQCLARPCSSARESATLTR